MENFVFFLKNEKKVATNTVEAYLRDLEHFADFLKSRGIQSLNETTESEIVAYLMNLKASGKSKSTVNRKLASLRTFFSYLVKKGILTVNPAEDIKSPKIEKKDIEFLSVEEIDRLLELPDDSFKGIRDRAILELLYATGIRASELIDMKLSDVNLRMGFIKCEGVHSKARIIPMGRPCRKAMEDYIYDSRNVLSKGNESEYFFLNYMGGQMTRQGLWKVLTEYGIGAELSIKLTPQIIRNSFAVHMLQHGADVKSLQELMGHEDIAATQAYLAVTKNRIKDVYDKAHPRA